MAQSLYVRTLQERTHMTSELHSEITNLLQTYRPISLEAMKSVKLMNRIDTKYLLPLPTLAQLLRMARGDYKVQETNGIRTPEYHTVYLDTPGREMYHRHQSGHKVREKIRLRTYCDTGDSFLEVKNKNNHGRTDKRRIHISSLEAMEQEGAGEFLARHALYTLSQLRPDLENTFRRITLVNQRMTERMTIDLGLEFHDLEADSRAALPAIAIVELKRDGRTTSPIRRALHQLHVQPASFSKYCIGCALTNPGLKQNRFKNNIRLAQRLSTTK